MHIHTVSHTCTHTRAHKFRNIFDCKLYMKFHTFFSYSGHLSSSYKLDSCVSHTDAYIVSGSEDGKICFWDLVEVSSLALSY